MELKPSRLKDIQLQVSKLITKSCIVIFSKYYILTVNLCDVVKRTLVQIISFGSNDALIYQVQTSSTIKFTVVVFTSNIMKTEIIQINKNKTY